MPAGRIRKCTLKDLAEIVAIQDAITKGKTSRQWIEGMKRQLTKSEVIGFVSTIDKEVVGFIIGEIKGPGFGIERSGWTEFAGVDPRYMGSGIGKALAKHLFAYFKKKGVCDIYTAARWDAGDILSFLKSIGFNLSDFVNLYQHLDL
jgi:ribosomal protein S18 acetylase RimI-like enzyme